MCGDTNLSCGLVFSSWLAGIVSSGSEVVQVTEVTRSEVVEACKGKRGLVGRVMLKKRRSFLWQYSWCRSLLDCFGALSKKQLDKQGLAKAGCGRSLEAIFWLDSGVGPKESGLVRSGVNVQMLKSSGLVEL